MGNRRCKKLDKGKKKVEQWEEGVQSRTVDDSESDPDVVFIGEEADVTIGSGSGPTDPRSVVFIGEEAKEVNRIRSWSKNATDESESETSSDEDNDDPKDTNFQDDGEESKTRLKRTEEVDDSQEAARILDVRGPTDPCCFHWEEAAVTTGSGSRPTDPDIVFTGEEAELDSGSWSKNATDELNPKLQVTRIMMIPKTRISSGLILPSDGEESKSSSEEDREVDDSVQIAVRKDRRTRKKILKILEFVKFVVDSIINVDDRDKPFSRGEERGSSHRNISFNFPARENPRPEDSPIYGEGTRGILVSKCQRDKCILTNVEDLSLCGKHCWRYNSGRGRESPYPINHKELYNTLPVVSPKFAGFRSRNGLVLAVPLTRMAEPYGDTLKPTALQKELLTRIPENPGSFYEQNLVSPEHSAHPSLVANRRSSPKLEDH
ncbi:hypothetical protein HAX54_022138 [Datura stramonium]|uniref:Uncharacterized protein n=1 Tax=Datura stramonium TaxID=4076 RepID=A0ABS8UU11_DATST|nr:hypothetical protein [Datura stramonium]